MLFHLLPHFIPVKTTKNIVIVVCPLNPIIEDQLKVLKARRITADVLQLAVNEKEPTENLFGNEQEPSEHVVPDSTKFPGDVVNGNTSIVFAHPEALLADHLQMQSSYPSLGHHGCLVGVHWSVQVFSAIHFS